MFQAGYILNRRDDWIWFLGLPFVAVAFAVGADYWLPFATLAAVHLWVTVPHHWATWLRTYGHRPDLERFYLRLFLGPILISALVLTGAVYAPLTLFLVIRLWDTQHGLMQQHGFGRIYDVKAGTGVALTGRFDLGLNAVLYINMLIASPLFTQTFWVPALYKFGVVVSAEQIASFQQVCWAITLGYCAIYAGHLLWCVANGHRLNPVKYGFLISSYFLWYYTAWHTNSVLVWGIAHRLMHGLQYIVMVHSYMQRAGEKAEGPPRGAARLFERGQLHWFLGSAVMYAVAYQLLMDGSLADFGFGFAPSGSGGASAETIPLVTQIRVVLVAESFQLVHFYFDSFIWRLSDPRVREGL